MRRPIIRMARMVLLRSQQSWRLMSWRYTHQTGSYGRGSVPEDLEDGASDHPLLALELRCARFSLVCRRRLTRERRCDDEDPPKVWVSGVIVIAPAEIRHEIARHPR